MTDDDLGRVTERYINGDLVGLWSFDSTDPNKGLGLLDYEDSQFQDDGSRLQKFYYYSSAATGRKDLLQVTHRFYENGDQNDFKDYSTYTFTDSFYARPKGLRYPGHNNSETGSPLLYEYNNAGFLIRERDPTAGIVYREISSRNSRSPALPADQRPEHHHLLPRPADGDRGLSE